MSDIRIVQVGVSEAITLDWLRTTNALLPAQNGLDETQALVTAVTIAFCTDRLAETSDVLPIPGSTDRKGWWGDDGAADIWNGWPVGSRFWLMARDKITDFELFRRLDFGARHCLCQRMSAAVCGCQDHLGFRRHGDAGWPARGSYER